MLQVEGLSFFYGDRAILNEVSFTVASGELAALTGSSGEGKTTLARIIAGHVKPSKGRVLVAGRETTGKPCRDAFLVSQETDLFGWQTVRQHLVFASGAAIDPSEILKLVHLEEAADLLPKQLSGGMQKRLALARALAVSPKILILDEVFGSQDEALRDELLSELRPYWRERKTSVLLVTHDSAVTERFTDRRIALRRGSVFTTLAA